jgi:hypothetical protein
MDVGRNHRKAPEWQQRIEPVTDDSKNGTIGKMRAKSTVNRGRFSRSSSFLHGRASKQTGRQAGRQRKTRQARTNYERAKEAAGRRKGLQWSRGGGRRLEEEKEQKDAAAAVLFKIRGAPEAVSEDAPKW